MKYDDEWLVVSAEDIKEKPAHEGFIVDTRKTAETALYKNEYLRAGYEMDFAQAVFWVGMMNEA